MRSFQDSFTILNAVAATGAGSAMLVSDFRDLMLAIQTSGSANFTLKVQGSMQNTQPTWGSAATATNQWTYIQIIDLADQSVVNGATGVTSAGSDVSRSFEVNVNGLQWINVNVTAYVAGAITAIGKPFNANE